MAYQCFKCSHTVSVSANGQVARRETCEHCGADMHSCLNCKHYDSGAYNGCREPQAERVLDKDRGNFCDYFHFLEGARAGAPAGKPAALKKLDDLFK